MVKITELKRSANESDKEFGRKKVKLSKIKAAPIGHNDPESSEAEWSEPDAGLESNEESSSGEFSEAEDASSGSAAHPEFDLHIKNEKAEPRPQQKSDSKESHAAAKALRRERQSQKPLYDIRESSKEIWGKVREKNTKPVDRKVLLSRLMELIEGKIPDFALKHDTSRILQTCLKYGSKEQIAAIASELKGRYVELSKKTHGRFIVEKILRYWENRNIVIHEMYGHVTKLMRHKIASHVIEACWSYGNSKDRIGLIREFYGPEYQLFDEKKDLDQIISENPAKKESILKSLSEVLASFLNKGTARHSIVHYALFKFFQLGNEKSISDMIPIIQEYLVEILHTWDGARVAMLSLVYATPKERKIILKSFRTFIVKICCEEYGYLVLLRAFDVVDDTILLKNIILKEMTEKSLYTNAVREISQHRIGSRVLMYLFSGRSPFFLNKPTRDLLASTDEIRAKMSKKDPKIRARELLDMVSPELIKYATDHTLEMLDNPFSSKVLSEILLHATKGDKLPILYQIAKEAEQKPYESHIMFTMANHTLKILIHGGHYQPKPKLKDQNEANEENHLSQENPLAEFHFPRLLLASIQDHLLEYATHLTGSFPVLALLETDETKVEVRQILSSHIEKLKGNQHLVGVQLILKELGYEVTLPSKSLEKSEVSRKRKRERSKQKD